jgi:hypothetical protein
MALIEDGIYAYLSTQANIISLVGDRIYPTLLPQIPTLPAIVFFNMGSDPIRKINGAPDLVSTEFQFHCFATELREAKLISKALRDSLESYVGLMGDSTVRAVLCSSEGMDDYDDVPNDFRVISEYEIWHLL